MAETITKIKPTECLRVIQNLFAQPKYTSVDITMEAWMKLMSYIHLVGDKEITGLGRIKDNTIIDFKIPYQIVDKTTADATDEDMIALLREFPVEEIEEWELDWHSHVDMEVFMSTTDETNYELMSMARGNKQFPLLVVNKKGEVCFKNFIHKGKITDIKLNLIEEDLSEIEIARIYEEAKSDVAEKVSERKVVYEKKQQKINWYGNYMQTNNKNAKKQEKIVNAKYNVLNKNSDKEFCEICGVELVSLGELTTGLCEDCQSWGYGQYYGR